MLPQQSWLFAAAFILQHLSPTYPPRFCAPAYAPVAAQASRNCLGSMQPLFIIYPIASAAPRSGLDFYKHGRLLCSCMKLPHGRQTATEGHHTNTAQALPKHRREACFKPAKAPVEKTADLIHIKALQYRKKCSIIIRITIDITIGRKTYEYIICIFRKLQQARA